MEPATQPTTSDFLYKKLCSDKLEEFKSFVDSDLQRYSFVTYNGGKDLLSMLKHKEYIQGVFNTVKSYTIPTMTFNPSSAIAGSFSNDMADYGNAKEETERKIQELKDAFEENWQKACDAERQRVKDSISPLSKKHQLLLKYKPRLAEVMNRYGILPSDVKVSEDITREEFEKILEQSLRLCKEFDLKKTGLVDLILSPFEEDDDALVIIYTLFLILLCKVASPIIAIAFLVLIVRNTKRMYQKVDDLRIVESLMYSIDYDKLIPDNEKYVEPERDTTELDAKIAELQEELSTKDPSAKLQGELSAYKTDTGLNYVASIMEEANAYAKNRYNEVLSSVKSELDTISAMCEEEQKHLVRLGDAMNKSAVLDTNFTIGYSYGSVPIKMDFGLTNLNFVGEYKDSIVNFIKMLYINMLMGVRANKLETTVFDVDYLGQTFAEFINPKTEPYIKIASKDVNKVIEEAQKHASESILEIKTDDIRTYNKKNEELGMITRTYYLYIFLTGMPEKIKENKAFMEFLSYSANCGVFVWTIYKEELPNSKNMAGPPRIDGDRAVYDYDLGSRAIHTFMYDLEHNKVAALDYRKGYLLKYLPEDKWWKQNSIKGIELRFGLENGDPAKAYTLYFDDKNVHFLLGGATGAGKSVAIDCAMQTMLHEYAPDELQLVYIDLKNAEVAKYTKDGICLIPHCIIAAGTTDGEYCLSIFDWAYEEMIRRMNLCRKYGQQKIEGLRKKFDDPTREDYDPEVHVPRVVILIDEFQVMFNTSVVSAKIIDQIIGKLTSLVKLARAASMHLWFTSQEMSGTLPKNVLGNFSGRGALRCQKDVSTQIIGNDASGTIKDKVGWMYTNDSAGEDKNANKLWRVPFAPTDDLMTGIYEVRDMAEKLGKPILNAKFFDEKQGRNAEDLKQAYYDFKDFKNPNFIVLGERTVYSTKPTPVNFRFVMDDKENLMIAATERQDAMDLIGTVIDNIRYKDGEAVLLMSSADKDTNFLLNLEQYMPEGWEDFLYTNRPLDDIFQDLDDLIAMREDGEAPQDKPMYIMFIMWEKLDGIGVNENYRMTEKFAGFIRRMNAVNIHAIFVSRDKGLPTNVTGMCNHKICAKVDESMAFKLIDDSRPAKFPSPNADDACFAYYKYGSDLQKFKIYRHKLERQLEAREL